jgi:signal transduction histidine kinase
MVRWPREGGIWLLVAVLAVLLGVLAALQYHWTGEIGRAEAERQRARLDREAQRYAAELGRALGRAVMTFRPEMSGGGTGDLRASLRRRLELWGGTERAGLVSRLLLLTRPEGGPLVAEAADPEHPVFAEVPLPSPLEPLRSQLEGLGDGRSRGSFPPHVVPGPPTSFLMPVMEPDRGGSSRPGLRPAAPRAIVVVELSDTYLSDVLLPELAEIHFGPLDAGDYVVAVKRRRDGSLLYTSDPGLTPGELDRPDLRLDLPGRFGGPGAPGEGFERGFHRGPRPGPGSRRPEAPPPPRPPGDRPPPPDEGPRTGRGPAEGGAPWVLLVRHRGGSLAEAVDAVRQRNLAVGLGVLALLGGSAVLLAVGGQKARQLAQQQLGFVAGVTHELHTPLTALRSAGQNLADGVVSDPEQVRRYGQLIQKEGDRLTALVGQVLDFAGIESGSRTYDVEPVPVEPLVRRTLADMRLVLAEAAITVEVEVPEDLPDIRGDERALRRALENLLTNAAKFARKGGWIGVGASADRERGRLTLRVEDRGPGIPRAERDRVFEPFYRGRDVRRGQPPGSGLGLSLVLHVAQGHGGSIRVGEREGGGAVVSLELPTMETPAKESS